MCGTSLPAAMNSRLIQPKLMPASPPAVLVMTRPCQAGATATLAEPFLSRNTMRSVWLFRNAASSPKLAAPARGVRDAVVLITRIVAIIEFRFMIVSLRIEAGRCQAVGIRWDSLIAPRARASPLRTDQPTLLIARESFTPH